MGPLTAAGALPLVDSEDVAWFRDRPDGARGAAAALGRRIGLGEQRTAELVLAVAELAANVTKYAVDGSVLLRVVRNEAVAGVELIVVDSGPGMADVPGALRDGSSTAGTLGIGLGAVDRLADTFDIHSQPGLGTVQLARFWPHPLPPSVNGEPLVAGITRPIGGEQVCGDAWAARTDTNTDTDTDTDTDTVPSVAPPADNGASPAPDGPVRPSWSALTGTQPFGRKAAPRQRPSTRPGIEGRSSMPVRAAVAGPGQGYLVMSCDGLGHGPLASVAAQAAVHAFRTGGARTPEQAIEHMHRALRGTRGAAIAVARIEPDGRLLFCGVGNITTALVTTGTRSTLLSHPGIVGHQVHQLRTYEHHLPSHGILVMHSDGLSERWRPVDLAGLLHHPPALIATALLRHAGTRRDDASVVIARRPR